MQFLWRQEDNPQEAECFGGHATTLLVILDAHETSD